MGLVVCLAVCFLICTDKRNTDSSTSRYFFLSYNSGTVQQGYREKSIIKKEEIPIFLLTGDSLDQNVMQTQYLAGNPVCF